MMTIAQGTNQQTEDQGELEKVNGNGESENNQSSTELVMDEESTDLASPTVRRSARTTPRKNYEAYDGFEFTDESSEGARPEAKPKARPEAKPKKIREIQRENRGKIISPVVQAMMKNIMARYQCNRDYAKHYCLFCDFVDNSHDQRIVEREDGGYITRINVDEYFKFKVDDGVNSRTLKDIKFAVNYFSKRVDLDSNFDAGSPVFKQLFEQLQELDKAKKPEMPLETSPTTLPPKRNRTKTKIFSDEDEDFKVAKKKRATNKIKTPKPAHTTNDLVSPKPAQPTESFVSPKSAHTTKSIVSPKLAHTAKSIVRHYKCCEAYGQRLAKFLDFVDNNDDERIGKSEDGDYLTEINVDEFFRVIEMTTSVAKQTRSALSWWCANVEKKENFVLKSLVAMEKADIKKTRTATKGGKRRSGKKLRRDTSNPEETWSRYCDWVDETEGTEKTEDNRYLTRGNVDRFFSEYLQNSRTLSPRRVKKMKSDLQWCALNIEIPKSGTSFIVDSHRVEEAIAKHAEESFARNEEKKDDGLYNEEFISAMALEDRITFEPKEDCNKYYIEEEAHLYHNPPLPSRESEGVEPQDLKPIPPPEPLPEFPTTGKCEWKFDEIHRVLLADFSPSSSPNADMDPVDERFFLQMLERNDITVVSEGLVSTETLDPGLWKLEHMQHSLGGEYYHKFRRFDTTMDENGFEKCREVDSLLSMKIGNYIDYLNKRQDHLSEKLRDPRFTFIDHEGNENNIQDVGISALYMIDMDIIKSLPGLYSNFMESFKIRELLPGGLYCMMNKVTPTARPFMGPNMYVTPPASFTHFHQDGHGTVDSGHLCLNGYNEVVMLRRLTERHKKHALMILTGNLDRKNYFDGLYQVPHGDELGEKPAWPTKDKIEECRQMGYCPTVFILKPGQLVHINKGRLHAFRKMSTARLPDDDCHKELREQLIKERNIKGEQLCISIAWDWMFLGVTARGINREVLTVLEAAILNRKNGKISLAIPEMSLLQMAKYLPPPKEDELPTGMNDMVGFMNTDFKQETDRKISNTTEVCMGILPGLYHVVTEHINAMELAAREECRSYERGERVTVAQRPNTHENPSVCPVDPYGNNDFLCKMCNKELSNVYFHCDGCEKLLSKDFNICRQCHAEKNFMITVQMHPTNPKRHATLNHIGNFRYDRTSRCICKNGPACGFCGYCLGCSCRCHSWFTLHNRLFCREEEQALLHRVVDICVTMNSHHFEGREYFEPGFTKGRLDVASRKFDD
mmetsp:Transcript_1622/g.2385  ORF Transcript_1622/g.2385 Transcript_1622/m.2385 type:complete len:1247 (+) Transcript_1622:125-3865(+)